MHCTTGDLHARNGVKQRVIQSGMAWTKTGMNAARAKGSRPGRPPLNPEKLEAALLLVKGGMSPTKAARQTALGRSTLYREIQARDHCLSS